MLGGGMVWDARRVSVMLMRLQQTPQTSFGPEAGTWLAWRPRDVLHLIRQRGALRVPSLSLLNFCQRGGQIPISAISRPMMYLPISSGGVKLG